MLIRRVVAVTLMLLLTAGLPVPARADVTCIKWNEAGSCVLTVPSPNDQGPGSGSAPASGSTTTCTTLSGDAIACTLANGAFWSRANWCYLKLADPQPTPDQLDQGGKLVGPHPGEKAFVCFGGPSGNASTAVQPIIWLPVAPAIDPLTLSRQAITQMNLGAITVGIVPDPVPGRVGIIGMPTWMWAETPSENTTGPITRSASSAGNTVTATATVKRIVWDMGDGHSVTCTGPGTRYEDRYGKSSSPTCGYRYTRQGDYTVTATSYWEVAWNGMGQSGIIPLNFSRSASITMGEIQVLRR